MFRNFIMENFPFLEDDFDALTDYELFCKMIQYVKEIVKDDEEFNIRLTNLENYINNLDLQEEVNNKLDEMAESGELAEIISQYLQLATTFTYKTIAEMKESENLVNGSFAKTKGFRTFNDGGGANYYIRSITNEDVIDNIHLFAITYDNTLVAQLLEKDTINIKQLGAKSDIDNTNIINYALNNFNEVIVPNENFGVSDSLILKDYNYLHGLGHDSVIFMNKQYTMPMIKAENVDNIKIENISFTNGESDTSSGIPNNQIAYFNGCDYIDIKNIKATDIYSLGLVFKKCGFINIINSMFKNSGHSMISFLTETHDILVDNCVLDNITGTDTNPYLLSTGSNDYVTQVEYLTKNLTIQNSTFKNNPLWEGIDSHGCENFSALNNKVINCKQGIHVYYDDRTPTNTHNRKNCIIKNNIIINENNNMQYGIIVGGTENYYLNDIIIDNNIISGTNATSAISIYVLYANYFTVSNNDISNMGNKGINTAFSNVGNIINNYIHNIVAAGVGITADTHSWLIKIDGNRINCENLISRAITGAPYKGNAILGNNICTGYSQFKYYFGDPNKTLIGVTNINATRRLGCKGMYSRDDNDIITMYCTDAVIRSIAETTSLKVTASVNDTLLNVTDAIRNVCLGQEIVIAGAGDSGDNLTTTIKEFIGNNKIVISNPILTSVTNASISTTASTWIAA